MKRGGAETHVKSNEAKRTAAMQQLANELRKPSDKFSGGFLLTFMIITHIITQLNTHYKE